MNDLVTEHSDFGLLVPVEVGTGLGKEVRENAGATGRFKRNGFEAEPEFERVIGSEVPFGDEGPFSERLTQSVGVDDIERVDFDDHVRGFAGWLRLTCSMGLP
jgi:hypothetical protein